VRSFSISNNSTSLPELLFEEGVTVYCEGLLDVSYQTVGFQDRQQGIGV
jgi:hypothetical protein